MKTIPQSGMKAQASLELMITVGVVIAFTIPVLFLLFSVTQVGYENAATAQADATARALAETTNLVYSQGPFAKKVLLLNIPSSTQSINISDGEVIVTLKLSNGYYDASALTFANVTKTSIKDKKGLFPVEISVNQKGQVVVNEK